MTVAPPVGELALVFTDVESSTALWEAAPVGMRTALALHDALMRQLLVEHGGYEVKTEGDAFMVAFVDAAAALAWCLAAQVGLGRLAWPDRIVAEPAASPRDGASGLRVRMGVHQGAPECVVSPVTGRMDYFGPVVNRAARVAAAAHGGQILVSGTAWEAIEPPSEARIQDLGEFRFKGLHRPERLVEVVPAERTLEFPKPRTLQWRAMDREVARRMKGLSPTELGESIVQVCEALCARGLVRASEGGELQEGLRDLDAARVLVSLTDDAGLQGRVRAYLGAVHYHHADWDAAEENYRAARRHAITAGDGWIESSALCDLGSVDQRRSRFDDAQANLEEAFALATKVGNRRVEGLALTNLGLVRMSLGDLEGAEDKYRQAWPLLEEFDGFALAGVANNLGVLALELGRDDAGEILERALAHARKVGSRRYEGVLRVNLGCWRLDRGDPTGIDELQSGSDLLVRIGDPVHAGLAAVELATELHRRGEIDAALAVLSSHDAEFGPSTIAPLTLRAEARRGALLTDRGDDASAAFAAAEEALEVLGLPSEGAMLRVCRAHGQDPAVRARLAEELAPRAARSTDLRTALRCLAAASARS